MHKEFELSFTDKTIAKESNRDVPPSKLYDGFKSLDHAEKLPHGTIFDLVCILVTVHPLIEIKNSKLRKIVVTNELMEHTTVTLWGDFAENDDSSLEKLKDEKPILALCDVKVSIYNGTFGICTIPVSSLLINPVFEKATDLYCLRLEVCDGEQRARVVLFEVANNLLGCTVQEYIESTSAKREECHNYRKLVLSKDKQFTFLVRIDMNISNPRRSLIAHEIHGMEAEASFKLEEEAKPVRLRRKRIKKATDKAVPMYQKKIKAEKK